MNTIHLSRRDMLPAIAKHFDAREYAVEFTETVHLSDGYWSGGSKSEYCGVNLATGDRLDCGGVEFGNPFTHPDQPIVRLLPGYAVVKTGWFCGKKVRPTVYLHPDNAAKLLPGEPEGITDDMRIVLSFTRNYKSSYGGVSNLRFVEANRQTGITAQRWESAKAACIEKGFLRKNGAITPEGRNVQC